MHWPSDIASPRFDIFPYFDILAKSEVIVKNEKHGHDARAKYKNLKHFEISISIISILQIFSSPAWLVKLLYSTFYRTEFWVIFHWENVVIFV